MEGRLVVDWADQARVVTKEVVPKALIVDLTDVSYVDPVGEQLLKWLASLGAGFVADSVYALAVCERLNLPLRGDIPARRRQRRGIMGESNSDMYSHASEPDPAALEIRRKVSWFHASMKAVDDRNYASAAEIVACFRNGGVLPE